ncbi:MAG: geranylgeranylglyceryl/heptaprenylglyceryl phosphate synthase [Saprospiraceae bacterium]|nr:geranylgeranylglyceryl/heptaprenylglyceryl phosphate synthase [Saprospiraceae bacterium]MDW8229122.1 geranylgeranylglyceryl/heptaprenylglyceryl phosphate synthase [Saprospiraceae bacterium]
MHPQNVYAKLLNAHQQREKQLAVLLDPDLARLSRLHRTVELAAELGVHYLLVGGSLVVNDRLDAVLSDIRLRCAAPIVLFPGNSFQLSYRADALLFLSLISGRNADLLIGQHVIAAPFLRRSPLEIIPTGYLLIDGGVVSSVQYMSNTLPIPANKPDIAACTAMAGEMLGLKTIYLDAGSGAYRPVSEEMIAAVRTAVEAPLWVGGGIRTPEQAVARWRAGADVVVVGTAVEQQPECLRDLMAEARDLAAAP